MSSSEFVAFQREVGHLFSLSAVGADDFRRRLGKCVDDVIVEYANKKNIQRKKTLFLASVLRNTGIQWSAAEPHRFISALKTSGGGDESVACAIFFICCKTHEFESVRTLLAKATGKGFRPHAAVEWPPKPEYHLSDLIKDNLDRTSSASRSGASYYDNGIPSRDELKSAFRALVELGGEDNEKPKIYGTTKEDENRRIYVAKIKQNGRTFVETEADSYIYQNSISNVGALAIIDIDDLTKVNKIYGADVGDLVLEIVEIIINDTMRGLIYKSGRCGDDTFFVVVCDKGKMETKKIMDDLCRRVKEYEWSFEADGLWVSVSIGLAHHRLLESSIDLAIRGGKGMRRAKAEGGNRVSLGPDTLPHSNTFGETEGCWS